jgi:hypothetical protein
VRFVDVLVRKGHLSEQALTDAVLTGQRPAHLDRCDVCGERAVQLGRWLADLREIAVAEADEAFPAERLAVQQHQILRRLDQADEPSRVIEFPLSTGRLTRATGGRRVSPAWVGVAAAAGLLVGVAGGHFTSARAPEVAARKPQVTAPRPQTPVTPATAPATPAAASATPELARTEPAPRPRDASVLDLDLEEFTPQTLRVFDDATPRLVSYTVSAARR